MLDRMETSAYCKKRKKVILTPFLFSYVFLLFDRMNWAWEAIAEYYLGHPEWLVPLILAPFILPYVIGYPVYKFQVVLVKKFLTDNPVLNANPSATLRLFLLLIVALEGLAGYVIAKFSIYLMSNKLTGLESWLTSLL